MRGMVSLAQFPGQGQRQTPVTDEKGVYELIVRLSGPEAADVCEENVNLMAQHSRRSVMAPYEPDGPYGSSYAPGPLDAQLHTVERGLGA